MLADHVRSTHLEAYHQQLISYLSRLKIATIATVSMMRPIGTSTIPIPGSPPLPPNAPSRNPPGRAIEALVKLVRELGILADEPLGTMGNSLRFLRRPQGPSGKLKEPGRID